MDTIDNPLVIDPSGSDIQGESDAIRAQGPVTLIELPGGVRAWSVSDPDVLKSLLTDPKVSKDPRQHWPAFRNGEITQDWPIITWVAVQNMFTAYGADHRRLRKLVAPAFTNRRTQAMLPQIEKITNDLLAELESTPAGETVDLREEFCYPLPIRVISELMGVPEELNPGLRTCVDGIFDTTLTAEQAQANIVEMYRILGELVAHRRAEPGDDMTSLLISHHDDEHGKLSDQELVDTLLLVISAGHETTVNLLDQTIHTLLTGTEHRDAVVAGTVTWSDVIEESLRFEAPVAHLPLRYAVSDIDIEGTRIAAGDPILASYAAANRHPKWHGDTAGEFDPARITKDHLSFGYGAHLCLGAPLARLEATTSLAALFERFPAMRLGADSAELGAVPSFISNGHRSLPVYLAE